MSPEREQDHITIEEIISKAKEIMLRDGQHMPTLIMEASNLLVASPLPSLPVTHGEKVEFMRFVGQVAAKSGRFDQLQQVFMITEGWMSESSENMRPSQDPNKKEVLIISAIQMKERKKQMEILEILRDDQEQVVGLEAYLPDKEKKDEKVDIPLLDAFVQGFQTAFRTKFN
jgi:hypothetical protein